MSEVRPGYASLPKGAEFAGISTRHLRRLIQRGLPVYRLSPRGHLRVRLAELDEWIRDNCRAGADLDQIVDEVVQEFGP